MLNRTFTDGLVKKLEELEKTAGMYRGMMDHTKRLVKAFFDLSQSHKGKIPNTLFGKVVLSLAHKNPLKYIDNVLELPFKGLFIFSV